MNNIQPKKKNVLKFLNSEEWQVARVKMSGMFLLLSYANELKEDVDVIVKGFDGLFMGELKKRSNDLLKAFDAYDKSFVSVLTVGGDVLCDDNEEYQNGVVEIMESSQMEIVREANILRKYTKDFIGSFNTEKIVDECKYELVGDEERKKAIDVLLRQIDNRLDGNKDHDAIRTGAEIGFNSAIDWINRVFTEG